MDLPWVGVRLDFVISRQGPPWSRLRVGVWVPTPLLCRCLSLVGAVLRGGKGGGSAMGVGVIVLVGRKDLPVGQGPPVGWLEQKEGDGHH